MVQNIWEYQKIVFICRRNPLYMAKSQDQCIVTRTYLFLHKFWFFSTIYYFGNWAFIGAFLIGLVVSCCKGKKSVIEGEVEADDSDLSDDEYVH